MVSSPTLCRCILLFGLASPTYAGDLSTKKLIEFGWDEPGTEFLRTHILEMRQTPFDGCVFHVDYKKPTGEKGSFTWQSWGDQTFTEADLRDALADLRSTQFGRFKHNFLRFNTTPARLDWFDDHTAVLNNARLAARLARNGRCPGILFDIEQYEGQLFNYAKQRDAKTKSWELYATQARRRGREVMQSFQKGYAGLTVFLTFGYSLPWTESDSGKQSLATCNYGLLAPFLDGMVQAATGRTRLVDGFELSYGYKQPERFVRARTMVQVDLLPIVQDPEKYAQLFSLGFGLWMDNDWRKQGWNTADFSKNHFTPDAFETSSRAALQHCDEYVWIYSETPRWWSSQSNSVKLPPEYEAALRRARGPERSRK